MERFALAISYQVTVDFKCQINDEVYNIGYLNIQHLIHCTPKLAKSRCDVQYTFTPSWDVLD